MKKIIISGATGLIGKALCEKLITKGYEITIIARDISQAKKLTPNAHEFLTWSDKEGIQREIESSYGIINLAGSPIIGKRWTKEYKEILRNSRLKTTSTITEAINNASHKPLVFINGSAVGYYGIEASKSVFNEESPSGRDFLAQLCVEWEKQAEKARSSRTRVVLIRSGVVLDSHEGALKKMTPPFSFYVGGPIGSGKQYFPWIHIDDEIGIICHALENETVTGAINAVSPEIVTNKAFATTLGNVLHRPSIIPVPSFVLTLLFGEAASVLTTGVAVSSQKVAKLGYSFMYPQLNQALKNLIE